MRRGNRKKPLMPVKPPSIFLKILHMKVNCQEYLMILLNFLDKNAFCVDSWVACA